MRSRSKSSFVCAAETQNRALASNNDVAGYPYVATSQREKEKASEGRTDDDDNDNHMSLQHQSRKRSKFPRLIDEERDDGTIPMTEDDEPHSLQTQA